VRVSKSEVKIDAPRETVWAVLTEPRYVKQWQYGSDLDTDWSVGSSIRFTAEWDGHKFEQWGEVLLVDAPRELRYSLFVPEPGVEDKPDNRLTMIYSLSEESGLTRVTITQEDPRPVAPGAGDEDGDEGENPILAALRSLAESLVA
jgi:uncharacterized protein YndB with AHSA1/START domain